MRFSFNPSLGSVSHIRSSSATANLYEINFYAYENLDQSSIESASKIPEIWTNARLIDETDDPTPVWKALVFNQADLSLTPSQRRTQARLWQARLYLKPESGVYQFTYRTSTHGKKSNVEWLGSTGDNGIISVHAPSPSKSVGDEKKVLEDSLLLSLKAAASSDVITQHPLGITTHLFTFRPSQTATHTQRPPSFEQSILRLEDYSTIEGLVYERSKPTWYNPRGITALNQVSQTFDTQTIIFRRPSYDDLAVLLFPLSDQVRTSSFRASAESQLKVCTSWDVSSNEALDHQYSQITVATGPDWALQSLLNAAVDHLEPEERRNPIPVPQKLRYCTWNALGPDYSLSKLINALEDFEKSNMAILLDGVLLDDGWQDVKGRTLSGWGAKENWNDLEPRSEREPDAQGNQDLSVAIKRIRESGRGSIRHVGVWLTLNGYWEGLDPQSTVMKPFNLQRWLVRRPDDFSDNPQPVSTWHLPSLSSVPAFWDQYFTYLKSVGVDFIKVDNQATLDYVFRCESHPSESAHALRMKMWNSMMHSAYQIFGSDHLDPVVHCMAHSPRIWGQRANHSQSTQLVLRTSDDFFPDVRDDRAHHWHLVSNAFNSLLASGLGMISDFDMVMSRHPFSTYHAALRVLSPSPIYITDRVGQHDFATCRMMTAPLKAGGYATVQSSMGAGKVLAGRCLGIDLTKMTNECTSWGLLKIGLPASLGGALMGLWNVRDNSTSLVSFDLITKRDIAEAFGVEGLDRKAEAQETEDLIIYSRKLRTFKLVPDFQLDKHIKQSNYVSQPVYSVSLRQNSFDMLTISRVWRIDGLSGITIATLGLLDPICGLAGLSRAEKRKPSQLESLDHTPVSDSVPRRFTEPRKVTRQASQVPSINTQFAFHGRLRFLFDYIFRDSRSSREARSHLASLLQDFFRSPLRTFVSESVAIVRMTLSITLLVTIKLILNLLPTSIGKSVYHRLSPPSSSKLPDETRESDIEHSPPMSKPPVPCINGDQDIKTAATPIENESPILRFSTPFTSSIGFCLMIEPDLIIKNEKESTRLKSNEIFERARELIIFKVDGIVIESALDFEKQEEDVKSKTLSYLVTLRLEQFAETHLVELGERDWLIEIERKIQ